MLIVNQLMVKLSDPVDLLPEQIFKNIRRALDQFTENAARDFHHFAPRFCAHSSRTRQAVNRGKFAHG